jgi:hypothetical protein
LEGKARQGSSLWEDFSFSQIKYVPDHGEKLYCHSLCTFWRRSIARRICSTRRPARCARSGNAQPADYWSGRYDMVLEASPAARWIMECGPPGLSVR